MKDQNATKKWVQPASHTLILADLTQAVSHNLDSHSYTAKGPHMRNL